MDREKMVLLEEAVQLELSMAELYFFYSNNFKVDKEFRRQKLNSGDKNHAERIKELLNRKRGNA